MAVVVPSDDSSARPVDCALEAAYQMPSAVHVHEVMCNELCAYTACWRVIWDEDACLHVPRAVCHLGKDLVQEIMAKLDEYVCTSCDAPLVPAIIVPLSN